MTTYTHYPSMRHAEWLMQALTVLAITPLSVPKGVVLHVPQGEVLLTTSVKNAGMIEGEGTLMIC